MPCIYETINLFNLNNNIFPYKYIGSDQNDNPNYLGSSLSLKNDIKIIGKENFKKRILLYYDSISNIELREEEKKILSLLDCAKNKIYYNKTNSSHKGYILNEIDKEKRKNQLREAWENWFFSLEKDDRWFKECGHRISNISKEIQKIDFWISKYGEDGSRKFKEFKKSQSVNKMGEKNKMSKYSDISKKEAIDLFFNKNIKRKEICESTGLSYGVLKLIIRNYKKNGLISVKNT